MKKFVVDYGEGIVSLDDLPESIHLLGTSEHSMPISLKNREQIMGKWKKYRTRKIEEAEIEGDLASSVNQYEDYEPDGDIIISQSSHEREGFGVQSWKDEDEKDASYYANQHVNTTKRKDARTKNQYRKGRQDREVGRKDVLDFWSTPDMIWSPERGWEREDVIRFSGGFANRYKAEIEVDGAEVDKLEDKHAGDNWDFVYGSDSPDSLDGYHDWADKYLSSRTIKACELNGKPILIDEDYGSDGCGLDQGSVDDSLPAHGGHMIEKIKRQPKKNRELAA